ncbi:MAG: hypothetical protein K8T10_16080 [Candidatus Eremiobacteraeota bacterium]|nr:hypothetical protein [Candidatus Eremiobacteraeota bacterium]
MKNNEKIDGILARLEQLILIAGKMKVTIGNITLNDGSTLNIAEKIDDKKTIINLISENKLDPRQLTEKINESELRNTFHIVAVIVSRAKADELKQYRHKYANLSYKKTHRITVKRK